MPNVYWLTGLSGAGKTTIGKVLYQALKQNHPAVAFLDGDMLRKVFGDDLGYTVEDRRISAMRNARLCKMLVEQDMDVVCCTISMFNSVREWNRAHIPGYVEVYIKTSMDILFRRNQKELYSRGDGAVAGVDFTIEEPQTPDIVLENNGFLTPVQQVEVILQYMKNLEM